MRASLRTVAASLSALIALALAAMPAAAETWSSPVVLQPAPSSDPMFLQVAGSASGAAAVVWFEQDLGEFQLWATVFEPGVPWSAPTMLKALPGYPDELLLAGDDAGNFFAVCLWSDGIRPDVFGTRYAAGGGWSALALLETNDTHRASGVALAVAGDGNAAAVYQLGNGTTYGVFENVYVAGAGWGGPRMLFDGPAVFETTVAAAAVGTGDLMAAWMVPNTTYFDVRAAVHTAAGGFQSASYLGSGVAGGDPSLLIAGSKTGEATVFWISAGPFSDLFYRSFVPSSGWIDAVDYYLGGDTFAELKVCAEDGGVVYFAGFLGSGGYYPLRTGVVTPGDFLAFDRQQIATPYLVTTFECFGGGNVVLSWFADYAGTIQLWFKERAPSGAWSNPQVSPEGASIATATPAGQGGAVSVFFQSMGLDTRFYGAVLVAPDTVAPILSLLEPSDGAHVTQGAVDVRGATEPGASVTVNGIEASVAANGSFSLRVPLLPGANSVEVIARDAAGNAARTNVAVTFDDPLPAVVANLSAAEAAAAAARAESAALAGQVTALSAQLNTTASQATTMSNDLAAARTRLSALEQQHAALQAQVNASGGANPTAPAAFDPLVIIALLVAAIALAAAFIAPRMGKKSPP